MRITFITLGYSSKPVGGLKVIYEYANQLVARGHEVTIVHPLRVTNLSPHPRLTKLYTWLQRRLTRTQDSVFTVEVDWYPVDRRVRMLDVPEPSASYIPDGDAIFYYGENYPPEKGTQFIFLQGYGVFPKTWEKAAFRAPAWKIVIARWLYEQALSLGASPDEMIYIPNGIDHAKYRILHPIESRPPRIAMLYHPAPLKGAREGIKALEMARREFSTLQAVLFGVFPRPKRLPDWIEYHCDPPQEELVGSIYNGSSIYVCPSWTEGWHLPPAEAMACGCAVVSTDIGGVRDYAEHDVTALLSPPKDPSAMAKNLGRLLKDDDLRKRVAVAGHECIQEFTWEQSTDLLEQFIMDKIRRPGT